MNEWKHPLTHEEKAVFIYNQAQKPNKPESVIFMLISMYREAWKLNYTFIYNIFEAHLKTSLPSLYQTLCSLQQNGF